MTKEYICVPNFINMKKLLLFIFILNFSISYSQVAKLGGNNNKSAFQTEIEKTTERTPNGFVRCASYEYLKSKQAKGSAMSDEEFEKWIAPKVLEIQKQRAEGKLMLPAVIRIPVVVHVIHNGDAVGTGENIADAQVLSQITVLNQDYRKITGTPGFGAGVDTTIEFCMAQIDPSGNATNGIVRHNITPYNDNVANTNGADWETMDDIELAKANTIWDPTKYMNMWTFRFGGNTLANGGVSDLLGFAQFPSGSGLAGMPTADCVAGEASTDGLTMSFGTFGSRAIYPGGIYSDTQYDKGRTATHEIGHGFGLRHTWGDKTDCSGDDYCADVPPCSNQYFAAEATCLKPVQCSGQARQTENYMDYSDDTCMNLFTQNQKDRMLAVLQNSPRRDDLLVSPVCNAPTASIQFKRVDCSTRMMNSDVLEGDGCSYTEYTVPLSINKAPTQNAVVTFALDGTSTANANDYVITTPTVTFPTGTTADRNLVVRVLNDGYVEPNEDLVINFTVNANGGDAVAHPEGNKLKFTIVNDDVASAVTVVNTIINEDFEDATGWTLLDGDGDTRNWGLINADGIGTAPNTMSGVCAYSEKSLTYLGGTGNASPDNYLISPQITIPAATSSASLSYIVAGYGANAGDYIVYFTTNKSTAANITAGTVLQAASSQAASTSVLKTNTIPAGLYGQTGYIVFRHQNAGGKSGLLLLDTVTLNATVTTQVQTAVTTPTAYQSILPVNGTIYGRNTNGNVMADVTTSGTTFDYGCTSVSVSRDLAAAGAAAVNYGSNTAASQRVMAKRITVTPTTNNASGAGTIKFYFTDAEVAAWEGITGNVRANLKVIKGSTGTVLTTTTGTFGTNFTLTGTVTNGIGGDYYFGTVATLGNDSFEFASLNVYPNPNKGSFNIELQSDSSSVINVSVTDLRGRQIFDRKFANNGTFNQTINLENTQSGVYLVTITDGIKKTVKKIVIE